ncbi:hypothetical protein [Thioalkalivibrio sp. XN8]|uniref:hypothetical protein n=1 Tax=Thioalkalivibrio sp. XN8 TaxID=2712863 RepID=UPI0013EADCE6|nr:hypothetical protein [Thioalkalivibrio sp. XN8]NGP51996.1 hypothetical protein [Thioalkalivibrio sp. XN8]
MNSENMLGGRRKMAAILVVLLTVAVSWSGWIDRKTEAYVDDATVQALAAFATARLLNAVISMAQSVEVGQSSGLGVKLESSIRPLELLDPVNDLVEQYSTVMQFAVGSLVTQKLLIEIVSTRFFRILLTVFGVVVVASLFVAGGRYALIPLKLFALAALLRFLFVLVLAGNALVDQAFVSPRTQENMQRLEVLSAEVEAKLMTATLTETEQGRLESELEALGAQREALAGELGQLRAAEADARAGLAEAQQALEAIESQMTMSEVLNPFARNPEHQAAKLALQEQEQAVAAAIRARSRAEAQLADVEARLAATAATLAGEEEEGWWTRMSGKVKALVDVERYEEIVERIKNIVPNVLNLMALFVFQTLLMPLVFLYLLLRGFRAIWGVDFRDRVETELARIRAELRLRGRGE